jgi:hypothetical protein
MPWSRARATMLKMKRGRLCWKMTVGVVDSGSSRFESSTAPVRTTRSGPSNQTARPANDLTAQVKSETKGIPAQGSGTRAPLAKENQLTGSGPDI